MFFFYCFRALNVFSLNCSDLGEKTPTMGCAASTAEIPIDA